MCPPESGPDSSDRGPAWFDCGADGGSLAAIAVPTWTRGDGHVTEDRSRPHARDTLQYHQRTFCLPTLAVTALIWNEICTDRQGASAVNLTNVVPTSAAATIMRYERATWTGSQGNVQSCSTLK